MLEKGYILKDSEDRMAAARAALGITDLRTDNVVRTEQRTAV